MLARIRQWLAPPTFPDEEKTRVASLLNLLILAFIFSMLFGLVVLPILAPEAIPTLWLAGVVILVGCILREVMRRGRVRWAAIVLCLILWPLLVGYLAVSGGLTTPVMGFLCIAISAGVLLFGTRGALLFGILNILATVGLYWAGSWGLLTSIEGPPTLTRIFLTDSLLFIVLATLVAIGGHSVQLALDRARRGEQLLAERNEELQREIAERTQVEEALRKSEERYRIVSHMISDYAFCNLVEPDGSQECEWITESATRLTGYSREELFRREPQRRNVLFHPQDQERVTADMKKVMQGEPIDGEYRIMTKSGDTRWVRFYCQPIWDETEQRVVRFYGVTQDISERQRIKEELQRRDAILEAISAASSRFLKAPDWQQEIGNVLGILGKAAAADRTLVHDLTTDAQGVIRVSLKYEWDAPGVPSQLNNPRLHNVDVVAVGYGPHFECLARKQAVFYHTRHVAPERQATSPVPPTQSSLHLPIFLHGEIWGSLHFSTVREEHEWSKPELEALQIAADMLGTVMERKEAEDALQHYAARLMILHQIDRAILAAASPREIAGAAIQHIYPLIPYQRAMIEVLVFDTGERVLLAAGAGDGSVEDPVTSNPLDTAWIDGFRQDQAYFITDLRSLPDLPSTFQPLLESGVSSLASLPLIAHGKLLGYLNLLAKELDIFTVARMEIAREIANQLAIAIHQVYLFETERSQRALAEALRDSTAVMSGTLDFDDVLERILTNVKRVVPHEAAHIMLLRDGVAYVVSARGWVERGLGDWIARLRFTFDAMPQWRKFFTGPHPQSYLVADTHTDLDWVRFEESNWIRSAAVVPITTGEQLIGILHLDSATPDFFTRKHLERLETFANQAAIAIHNAQLFQAEQRRRQIAETLVHAAAVLTSTLKLNQVLDLILQGLHDVIDYDSASIQQLMDDELVIIACLGFQDPDAVVGIRFPLAPKFPNWRVATEKEPLAVPDVIDMYPHFRQESRRYVSGQIRAWLGLPLLSKDRLIGMITLDWVKVRPFAAEEIELAMAFANQAAVAIENAQLYEQTQRHATDLEQRVKDRTAELEDANEELRALSRLKDEFVSNVSHELRTPITNLNLRYHLMSKQPELLPVHLPVIRRETGRLARIIDDLLTLSRMDQERTPFQLAPIDLNPLVRQFVIDRIPQAESLGILLSANCIAQPLPVQADAGLLEQALSVLLTNALNYTPSDGKVTVSTQVRRADERCWAGFSVQDTGPGISKEEQARLFMRFFRGAAGYESRVAGTGLGLAIAREIVTRHHGQIDVESAGIPGLGSLFTVWLPMSDMNLNDV